MELIEGKTYYYSNVVMSSGKGKSIRYKDLAIEVILSFDKKGNIILKESVSGDTIVHKSQYYYYWSSSSGYTFQKSDSEKIKERFLFETRKEASVGFNSLLEEICDGFLDEAIKKCESIRKKKVKIPKS